jgi:hypothetical protein
VRSISQLRRRADLHAEKALAHRGLFGLAMMKAHKAAAPMVGSDAGLVTAGIGGFLSGKLLGAAGQTNEQARDDDNRESGDPAVTGNALRSVALSVVSRYAFQLLEPLLPRPADETGEAGEGEINE